MHNADLKPSLIDLEAGNTATGGKQDSTESGQPERLSERDNYCVYWIHTDSHKDPFCEGYVGITRNFKTRMKAHRKNKKKSPIVDAISTKGWKELNKEILHKGLTEEEALYKEASYRPSLNIGWNLQKGGEIGVSPEWYEEEENRLMHSEKTSLGTLKGIRENDTTEERSKRAKKSRKINAASYRDNNRGSKNPKARLNESQVYDIKFKHIPKGMSNPEIAKIYNVKPYVIAFIRKGKTWRHVVCDSPAHK